MVYGNSFLLVRGAHSNPLRSRERRFESCRGYCVMSQEIGMTRTHIKGSGFWVFGVGGVFWVGAGGRPVGW